MKKYLDSSLSAEERAIALTDAMTVEEQASQLKYDAPAVERLGIPAYNWWNEGLHGLARSGVATMFPQAIGLAAMFDTELTQKVADITAEEARAKYNAYTKYGDRDIYKGLTIWAPNINIFRDPRWGRGHETYGEDPYLTAENGKAFVKGLQGEGKTRKAAACAKHYAAHSGPEAVRHEFNAEVSKKDMEETYLPAFEALVAEAHVEGVMGAYNRVNGEAACASSFLMSKLKEWGFDGYFVSDCWAVRDFHEHHGLTANPVESVSLAIKSGCVVNCGCTYAYVLAALDQGLITGEDIRNACIHAIKRKPYGNNLLIKVKDEVKLIVDATPSYERYDCQKIIEANKKKAVRHAYFREYLALQRLCLLILQHQKHQIGAGSKQIYGILFDGAWLWEEYIGSLVDNVFYHPMNKAGKGAQRLFGGNIGLIYPDFISRDHETRVIADAKYKPLDNIGNKDYLQVLAYMLRFDAKKGYYLYPEAEGADDLQLWLNKGSTYEANVVPRDDICIIKHGLKIPIDAENYESFVSKMQVSESEFRQVFIG